MNRDNPTRDNADTLGTLLLLIETAKDGEYGFMTAA